MDVKNMALRNLKAALEFKLDNVTEKPLQILKRLDKYVEVK